MSWMGEQGLWRAVICQALQDLSNRSLKSEQKYYARMAECWIFSSSEGFYMACDYAGYHPDTVRAVAKRIKENGLQTRLPIGQGKHYNRYKKNKFNTITDSLHLHQR